MTLSSYADLASALDNYLHRTNVAARVQEWVTLTETELRRRLRIREQESATTVAILSGIQTSALPTGYLGARRLYLSANPQWQITYSPPENFWGRWDTQTSGMPREFTVEGNSLVWGPMPDAAYTANILPFILTAFTSVSAVPLLFTSQPDLYLSGCLVQSERLYGVSDEGPQWREWFETQCRLMTLSNANDRLGPGPFRARPDFYCP